jgi:RNA polymerase sigma-70 factor, ECF subfamily
MLPMGSRAREMAPFGEAQADVRLAAFHAGEQGVLERCYRDCYEAVSQAVGRVLSGADQETVVHEVFFRVLTDGDLRRRFRGGSLAAWLTIVARNHAIDFARRRGRESPAPEGSADAWVSSFTEPAEARLVIDRFRAEVLPPKWARTFELRFLLQWERREVAQQLGISRATVAYREMKIRAMLRRHVLRREAKP